MYALTDHPGQHIMRKRIIHKLRLTNPSPGIGWKNSERMSLVEREPAEMVFALALIHHLAIGSNLPFNKIAHLLSKIGESAIIEFIPTKND